MTLLLGLGIIGSRSADQLAAAGQPLKTWNRTPKDRPDSVPDPADATSEAEVILSYLRDEVAVREVFTLIKASLDESKTFINHATIDPDTTMWLARQCQEIGCGFLDCPFTGSRDAAAGGNLVYYVAGDPKLLEKHRALLEITSREIIFLGQPPAATVVKITTNLATAASVQALTEAVEISRRHGVDPRAWHEAAKLNGCYAPAMGMKLPTMLENDFTPPFFCRKHGQGHAIRDPTRQRLRRHRRPQSPHLGPPLRSRNARCLRRLFRHRPPTSDHRY